METVGGLSTAAKLGTNTSGQAVGVPTTCAATTTTTAATAVYDGAMGELTNDAIVATSSVVLIGSFFWVPACLWWVWRNKCKSRRRKILFLGCLVLIFATPLPVDRRVTKFALWNRFLRYFSSRAVGEVEASRRQALFCLVPHGIFPFGIAFSALSTLNETAFNSLRPVVASIMVRTPIVGHILRLIGAVKASPGAMDDALRQGHSLSLAPGGIGEIFLDGESKKEFALIKGRKGFVRRAMAHGVSLVPVYVFGNSETFKRVPLPAVVENLSRLLKASIVLFWGRWGLPVPFKVPLTFAFGTPLEVERNPSPTPDQVDELHTRFCEALTEVFDRFKKDYGWGEKRLELR